MNKDTCCEKCSKPGGEFYSSDSNPRFSPSGKLWCIECKCHTPSEPEKKCGYIVNGSNVKCINCQASGEEGTHGVYKEMLKKHGGKTQCCQCTGHECKPAPEVTIEPEKCNKTCQLRLKDITHFHSDKFSAPLKIFECATCCKQYKINEVHTCDFFKPSESLDEAVKEICSVSVTGAPKSRVRNILSELLARKEAKFKKEKQMWVDAFEDNARRIIERERQRALDILTDEIHKTHTEKRGKTSGLTSAYNRIKGE